MLVYESESNLVTDPRSGQLRPFFGYLPNVSTSIKSLVSTAVGVECFDLGEQWKYIDHLVVSLSNGTDGTTAATTCSFADDPAALVLANSDTGSGSDVNLRAGVNYNGTSRVSSSAQLSGVVFTTKVTGRYFRVRVSNSVGVTQRATFYANVKGYTLTP